MTFFGLLLLLGRREGRGGRTSNRLCKLLAIFLAILKPFIGDFIATCAVSTKHTRQRAILVPKLFSFCA